MRTGTQNLLYPVGDPGGSSRVVMYLIRSFVVSLRVLPYSPDSASLWRGCGTANAQATDEASLRLRARVRRIRSHFLQAHENLMGDIDLFVSSDPVPRDAKRQTVCPPSPSSDA